VSDRTLDKYYKNSTGDVYENCVTACEKAIAQAKLEVLEEIRYVLWHSDDKDKIKIIDLKIKELKGEQE